MTLKAPQTVRYLNRIYMALTGIFLFLIVFLTVKPRILDGLAIATIFWGLGALPIIYSGHFATFSRVIIHQGGNDGLIYAGWGRAILRDAINGNFHMALRGSEDVFWFMPGLRYFRALEHVFFGDTNFGYLLGLILTPLAVYGVSRLFASKAVAFLVCSLYVLSTPIQKGVWSFSETIETAEAGFAEPLAGLLFLSGLLLVGRKLALSATKAQFGEFFIAGLFFGLAVFMRPNLAVAVASIGIGVAVFSWKGNWARMIGFALGSAIFGLASLTHNLYFAERFVLLTSASGMNMQVKPEVYAELFKGVVSLSWSKESADMIFPHLSKVFMPLSTKVPLTLLILAGTVSAFARFGWRGFSRQFYLVAAASVGMMLPFLVYRPDGRYGILPWMLMVFLAMGALSANRLHGFKSHL